MVTEKPPAPSRPQPEAPQGQGKRASHAAPSVALPKDRADAESLPRTQIPPIPSIRTMARCREKGCIFPVLVPGETKCAHHQLEESEPKHFLSLQPTNFLLAQAKFGLPDHDYDYSRNRDRRRLAAQRERQWEEVA
jgi:hypothetical protein